MEIKDIDTLLRGRFSDLKHSDNKWHAVWGAYQLYVLFDSDTDRLQIIVPIATVDRPDAETFARLLEANFVASFEARYAIYDDVLWAVFVTRLSTLTDFTFDAAITQVLELARTTGTSYTAKPVLEKLEALVLH